MPFTFPQHPFVVLARQTRLGRKGVTCAIINSNWKERKKQKKPPKPLSGIISFPEVLPKSILEFLMLLLGISFVYSMKEKMYPILLPISPAISWVNLQLKIYFISISCSCFPGLTSKPGEDVYFSDCSRESCSRVTGLTVKCRLFVCLFFSSYFL